MSDRAQLVAIAKTEGLASFGSVAQLRKRVADNLLMKALSTTSVEPEVKKAKHTAPSDPSLTEPTASELGPPKEEKGKEKKPKEKNPKEKKPKVPRMPTEYNIFVKKNAPYVIASGFKGRDTIIEIARLWRAHKAGTTLMLTDTKEEVELTTLTETLDKLSTRQLMASLAAHGQSVDGDHDDLVSRLAIAMLA
jgi:hypothetical protein